MGLLTPADDRVSHSKRSITTITFIMDGERKIHMTEEVPLNSSGAANIFLKAGKSNSNGSHDGTVIHLKTEKPSDLGLHINTTFSIASSKKMKLLFVLNFLLSVVCIVLSCSIAFYYWNEMISMKKQIDLMKDNLLIKNLSQEKATSSALVAPNPRIIETREPRMEKRIQEEAQNGKKFYVEDLGEDMLLVDSKKKNASKDNESDYNFTNIHKELLVVQFNGGMREINLGKDGLIGPWERDLDISSKNSEEKIELNKNYFTIKESGLYIVYAQITYLTQSPNCYYVWASQPGKDGRQLSACGIGDDSSQRSLSKSQITCSIQTVARLYKGDIVNMAQREPNRTLWLRPGYSYFGFIKLSS